jgi:hypothetical protein
MVQTKDGKRTWDDYSDFLTEKNQALAMRARFEIMLYLQGLDSNFLEQTPEAVAIREIEEEIQVKANEAIAELEKTQAEPEETKLKKATKKTTTKKRGRPKKKSSE